MPQLPPYSYTGPVDCSVLPDQSLLKDKSVIVTGGELPDISFSRIKHQLGNF